MATRGALGGLAEGALQAALLMDAAGKDDVFLETVGVGQAEVDVIDHAVMEIPDVIVVNKATTRSRTRWSARSAPCSPSRPPRTGRSPS